MNLKKSSSFSPSFKNNIIANNLGIDVPTTRYFKSKEAFDIAVGLDFIEYANNCTEKGQRFLVGLAHGQSPAGSYAYILDNFSKIKQPELLRFTFTNSMLQRQRNLEGVFDAISFVKKMLRSAYINKDQILGRSLQRDDIDAYAKGFNEKLSLYLQKHRKTGFDYVFLSSDPSGRVAGISRNATIFNLDQPVVIVDDLEEKEITATPLFLMHTKRIAFLATKADKRRALAMLYHKNSPAHKSPSFLRHMSQVRDRMCVFIDDKALTWPQLKIERSTDYGTTTIRMDLAQPYDASTSSQKPVILLLHGFLGLNSFDGLLNSLDDKKYISAAMHYGSIPHDLPPKLYSKLVLKNIDKVVGFFGSKGHPIYIFDHSMGNTYFMLMDRDFEQLPHIKQYLCGRIGSNPFFCKHAKHAFKGFLDEVLLPSVSFRTNTTEKTILSSLRRVVPFDTKKGVRKRAIKLTEWLIKKDSSTRDKIWKAAKRQVIKIMTNLEAVPHLDRIPIEKALSRLPAKIFAIQVHAALEESKSHDKQRSFANMAKYQIPILVIKSERDAVAKFDASIHQTDNIMVLDVTNPKETDLFREHLFHMAHPIKATKIISDFVDKIEKNRLLKVNNSH